MDIFPLNSSEVIPEWYLWGTLIFWGALALLFELFKKRGLHRRLAATCCPRHLTAGTAGTDAEIEMSEGGVDAKVELENDEVSLAPVTVEAEELELLSSGFDEQYKKMIQSMGDSFVRFGIFRWILSFANTQIFFEKPI